MPIYEYRCSECEQIFEEWQKTYEDHDVPCPVCGGRSERLISNTSFVLKGGGWFSSGYSKDGPSTAGTAGSSSSSSTPSAGSSGASDSGGSSGAGASSSSGDAS